MSAGRLLAPGVYWVGQIDWNLRYFHGYTTQRGSSYNAYLVVDEKIALIDTVKAPFVGDLLRDVAEIVPLDKIDYVVSLHVEMDHSGGIPEVLRACKNAKLVTSAPAGIRGLSAHFGPMEAIPVKTGDKLSLGARSLRFLQTPMLHWPDNTAALLVEEGILFSSDAFGQHYACSLRFDDEVPKGLLFAEAAKYYANIILPFGGQVQKTLGAVKALGPKILAPAHGIMWRTYLPEILGKYEHWASYENSGGAVVIYDTMWHATESMARRIGAVFARQGVPVEVMSLQSDPMSDIVTSMMEAKYVAIGSPTINSGILPTAAGLLSYVKGLSPKNKVGFAFGSYGWSGQGAPQIQQAMAELNWELPWEPFRQVYTPTEQSLGELEKTLLAKLQ